MKVLRLIMSFVLVSVIFTQCKKDMLDDDFGASKSANLPDAVPNGMFKVTVENVSTPYDYFAAGAEFGVMEGDETPPANPGETITFNFHAGPGHKLSFASMYGASNDMFYAPDDDGIALFTGSTALEGDITEMVHLWDAGTEVNGSGSPGTMETKPVEMVPSTEENIQVLLDYDDVNMFTLTIHVLPGSATPLSPVAWVVHYAGQYPIFTEGTLDYGDGLEALAEIGDPSNLSGHLKMNSGYVSPIAPGVWVVHHKGNKPVFKEGKPEYGEGLESLAEMGDPAGVYESLMNEGYETGVYDTKVDPSEGPLMPGEKYTFTFEAHVGDYLSFASMLGQSTDLFFAPGEKGIQLFNGAKPISGDLTNQVMLWDAGTEVNEYPGLQTQANVEENGNVRLVDDGFPWPAPSQIIKVTIDMN